MPNAKLGEQRVYRADLDSGATTEVAQLGRFDVVVPVGRNKRYRGKSVNDLLARSGSREALKELLQNQPGCQDRVARSDHTG